MIDVKELKHELETQDNRATRDPFFIVYDWERVTSTQGYTDTYCWVIDGDNYTDDELKEYLKENDVEVPDGISGYEFEELAEKHEVTKWYYVERRKFVNAFLTEKAAQSFIKANHYHWRKPHVYVDCLWRNEELKGIREYFLKGEVND